MSAARGLETRHLKFAHQSLKPHMGELLTVKLPCTYFKKKGICLLKEKLLCIMLAVNLATGSEVAHHI